MSYEDVPASVWAKSIMDDLSEDFPGGPEYWASKYYLTRHELFCLGREAGPHDPLGVLGESLWESLPDLRGLSRRMVWYMFMICCRESRHVNKKDKKYEDLCMSHPRMAEWNLHHVADTTAKGDLKSMFKNLPDVSLYEVADWLCDVFYEGKYPGGYGGKAWGRIASCLRGLVLGELSMSMFLDQSFSLAHNNGPIFNKGVFFKKYVGGGGPLLEILDTQRAGMLPHLLVSGDVPGVGEDVVQEARSMFSRYDMGEPVVDWIKVRDLGCLGNYDSKIKAQVDKSFGKGTVRIMPDVYLQTVKMDR